MKTDQIKPLHVLYYFFIILFLTIAGLIVSSYLSLSHYKVYTDIGYKSFCAVSKAINCDTVSQSPYSIFLGVPVPIWGVAGYLLILIITPFSLDRKIKKMRVLSTILILSLLYSGISLILGVVSAVKIHSYCIMCIVTYGINFMLLYMVWLTKRRYEREPFFTSFQRDITFWRNRKKIVFPLCSVFILLCISLIIFFPPYWKLSPTFHAGNLKTGFTEDGFPWIGAENPELTITEFADYQCFQCKKMHSFLRTLLSIHPDKLRLVHRHFPMDHEFNAIVKEPINSGSGVLALIAIYAAEQDQFWEINDLLYKYDMSRGAIYLKEIAESVDFDPDLLVKGINHPRIKQKLYKDIIAGLKEKINGTPSYIINGQMYSGYIPKQIIDSLGK